MSPKKGNEVNTGVYKTDHALAQVCTVCVYIISLRISNEIGLLFGSRQTSRQHRVNSHKQIDHPWQLLPPATLPQALRCPQSYACQLQGQNIHIVQTTSCRNLSESFISLNDSWQWLGLLIVLIS